MDALLNISRTLPLAPVGLAYNEQLQAIGGTLPYTWTVTSGSLPPGMALSTGGLLTAAAGAIPASATGLYSFRIRVRDALLAEDFVDYIFEVAPAAYERVPQYLLDPRLTALFATYLHPVVIRQKVERHFFRDLIGTGVTYVHYDRDIMVPDWKTPGNDVSLRQALEELYLSTIAAIRTINSIAPDLTGEFGLIAGTGVNLTPQVNGIRMDVIAGSAGGIQEANVEADVAAGGTQALAVPSHPDVIEVWIRDEFDGTWNTIGELNPRIAKKTTLGDVTALGQYATAVGCDSTGVIPFFFTCHEDKTAGTLVLNKYDGETMAFMESAILGLSGPLDGEPLIMINRNAPYEPIIAAVALNLISGLKELVYVEYATPDNLALPPRTNVFLAADIDASAIEYLPNEASAYNPAWKRIYGTVINDGGATPTGYSAVLALKISVVPGGPGLHNAVLVQIPMGAAPPVIGSAVSLGAANTDAMDVVFDESTIPNDLLWLVQTGRWTGAGGTLQLWKVGSVWPAVPVPPPVLPLPFPPAVTWQQNVALTGTDGMEVAQAAIALDITSPGKDALSVVYVLDTFLSAYVPLTAPLMHSAVLAYDSYDNCVLGPPNSLGGGVGSSPVVIDATAEGRFSRWWDSSTSASVFYVSPRRSPEKLFVDTVLFDSAGPKANVEGAFSFPLPSIIPTDPILVRPAHSTYGVSDMTAKARAACLPGFDMAWSIMALDTQTNPNPFRTYYDGASNVMFENNSPFGWHIKMEALINQVDPDPPNLAVACWQLAQGFQNYWNANSYFPSASCNPPGPGGAQGTVWDENETGTTLTVGQVFYPNYYSVLPGTWDLDGGVIASAFYYAPVAAGIASTMWLVFRYVYTPSTVLAAEAVIAAVLTAGPLPATGVYTLNQIATAMGHPEWVTNYTGAPFDKYEYRCFVNAAGTGYYQGWFSQNYINNAQVYGPSSPGESTIPFVEQFTVGVDAVTGVPTEFTISRYCRYAEVCVNGVSYWQGSGWVYGLTTNKISYLNNPAPGYTLHAGDEFVVKYIV